MGKYLTHYKFKLIRSFKKDPLQPDAIDVPQIALYLAFRVDALQKIHICPHLVFVFGLLLGIRACKLIIDDGNSVSLNDDTVWPMDCLLRLEIAFSDNVSFIFEFYII